MEMTFRSNNKFQIKYFLLIEREKSYNKIFLKTDYKVVIIYENFLENKNCNSIIKNCF
jgi:hypothetical protein